MSWLMRSFRSDHGPVASPDRTHTIHSSPVTDRYVTRPGGGGVLRVVPAGSGGSGVVLRTGQSDQPDSIKPAVSVDVVESQWKCSVRFIVSRRETTSERDCDVVETFINDITNCLQNDDPAVQTCMFEFVVDCEIPASLVTWCLQLPSGIGTHSKLDQQKCLLLRQFENLLACSHQCLSDPRLVRPLFQLLTSCLTRGAADDLDQQLVQVLHQLCIAISKNPSVLELLFTEASSHTESVSSNQFVIFSLLVPFVHRDGVVAQQARDDLLLIMALLSSHNETSQHIVNNSDFCPLLATGLSGLYSTLPRRIEYPSDDWNQLSCDDIQSCPAISTFLNSLEFCNAVVQVAHSVVSNKLQNYVYNGFLVSVLGPALHQSSMEEVIAATAYLELFLRKISDPGLLRTFLHFILVGHIDDINIAESLICRISSSPRLCMVTLTLFKTLIELNSEEVLFQLIFRYLVPCTHIMVSQQKCIRDIELYSHTAEKLISLTPVCSVIQSVPVEGSTTSLRDETDDSSTNSSSDPMSSPVPHSFSPAPSSPSPTPSSPSPAPSSPSPAFLSPSSASPSSIVPQTRTSKWLSSLRRRPARPLVTDGNLGLRPSVTDGNSGDSVSPSPCISRCDIESKYIEYLFNARVAIEECAQACSHWSAPYDGENPRPDCNKSRVSHRRVVPPVVSVEEPADGGNNIPAALPINCDTTIDTIEPAVNANCIPTTESTDVPSASTVNTDSTIPSASTVNNEGTVPSASIVNTEDTVPSASTVNTEDTIPSASTVNTEGTVSVPSASTVNTEGTVPSACTVNGDITTGDVVSSAGSVADGSSSESSDRVPSDVNVDTGSGVNVPSDDIAITVSNQLVPGCTLQSADDMESFLRQLSHVPSRNDVTDGVDVTADTMSSGRDVLTELDAVIDQLAQPLNSLPEQTTLQLTADSELTTHGEQTSQSEGNVHTDRLVQTCSLELPETTETHASEAANDSENDTEMDVNGAVRNRNTDVVNDAPVVDVVQSIDATELTAEATDSLLDYKYINNDSAPTIGPFLTAILSKLELMVSNPLYVNLQLTGLLSRLACYHQPLLRSLLLSHSLVFQPSIKSLLQVLTVIRHRLDSYLLTVSDYESLLVQASQYLLWRDEVSRGDDVMSLPSHWTQQRLSLTTHTVDRKKTLVDLFRRSSTRTALTVLDNQRGVLFINSPAVKPAAITARNESLEVRTKNAVYCAIVFREFLKELAAISQEHMLLQSTDPMSAVGA